MDISNLRRLISTIKRPTLLIDKNIVFDNIKKMSQKAKKSSVNFRPHFKTHQSAGIGNWYRQFGIQSITVSSLDMAVYFSNFGWQDITIALPVNLREIERINELSNKVKLNLLVESIEVVSYLEKKLHNKLKLWIKIDTGYNRTGLFWNNFKEIISLAERIKHGNQVMYSGILTHTGHSYQARSEAEIRDIYLDTLQKLMKVKEKLKESGNLETKISFGDTPCCSVIENFSEIDEIRPGAFIFNDLQQKQIGSCQFENIAIVLACPVLAKHESRNEILIHGGAVHLSKDYIVDQEEQKIFGWVYDLDGVHGNQIVPETWVKSLSQEHGIIKTNKDFFARINIGDMVCVIPVHSCLAVDLMRVMYTFEGEKIDCSPKFY
jgi:D-serine deaminase-like pyridoxal phosphate-dependent protein